MSDEIVKKFANIFRGNDTHYGTYRLSGEVKSSGKLEGYAATIKSAVTEKTYLNHLTKGPSIGIVPITQRNTCFFGVIDIDNYTNFDPMSVIEKLNKYKLPFIPIRSKSGSAHIYCFTKEEVSARLMQSKLREIASKIGYSVNESGSPTEIYPKQTTLGHSEDDSGSWINLPYPNELDDSSQTQRYAFDSKGNKLSISKFLDLVEKNLLTAKELESLTVNPEDILESGAPCLNSMLSEGKNSPCLGNVFMFNLAIDHKKRYGTTWEDKFEESNNTYLAQPLTSSDMQSIIKSVRKKDYGFTCKQSPLSSYCDREKCKTRKYGIGSSIDFPELVALRKLNTSPPIWYLDLVYEGQTHTLELESDELQSPKRFQLKCMERANVMPMIMKQDTWSVAINNILKDVQIIEVQEQSDFSGDILLLLHKFCTAKATAKIRDEIESRSLPFRDEVEQRTYFTTKAFMDFLTRNGLKEAKNHKVISIIKNQKELDYMHGRWNCRGKTVNWTSIKSFVIDETSYQLPKELEKEDNDVY